jgi:hypothetical protein
MGATKTVHGIDSLTAFGDSISNYAFLQHYIHPLQLRILHHVLNGKAGIDIGDASTQNKVVSLRAA